MRLEQRNGRVDRHGQERDVYAFHFTSDDEADLQFMARVVEKVNQARSDLGSVGQVIDSAILQHFTQGTLSDDALEARIQAAQQHPQEEEDLRTRDRGSLEQSIRAMQRLTETEMALDLSPEHAAHLLMQAVAHEQGELIETEGGRAYRFRKVPSTWKKLVKETIEHQSGSLVSLPKLVFDPAYFEEQHGARRIFKPRNDAELIRLGHPLMQRAIGVLRRRMWDGKGMTRWTLEGCLLPASLKEVLLLHLVLEVTNEFREVAHQEVILVPFEVRGYHLHPLEQDLWARLEPLPRTPLAQQELNTWTEAVRDQWHEHQRQIRTLITEGRDKYRQDFSQRMRQRLQEEVRAETSIFQERLRELERQKQPRYLEALQKEIEKQRKRLLQPALFTEIQQAEQQHLHQLEWDLAHTYIERMKALVQGEQKRILEQVLPRRYTLATVDLQPLAIEYIVRSTGNVGKEQR